MYTVVLLWLASKHDIPTYYIDQLLLTKFYERFKIDHISIDQSCREYQRKRCAFLPRSYRLNQIQSSYLKSICS